jgi:hypothetical protein
VRASSRLNRELDRRLREREERRVEAGADGRSEEGVDEHLDGAQQVAERDAAVDGEPLDLVEHRRVACIERVTTVRAPGRDDVDRRSLRLHRPHLDGRGVRAQQHLFGLAQLHVERVLHGAGRMTGWEVERLEVVPVGLDLGALRNPVAHADEHVFELAPDARDRMQVTPPVPAAAGGEVDPVVHQRRGASRCAEGGAAGRHCLLERGTRRGNRFADGGAIGRVDGLDRFADPVER